MVTPAPGEPGKMPFWKGDRAGRPLELGLAIGKLMQDPYYRAAPPKSTGREQYGEEFVKRLLNTKR